MTVAELKSQIQHDNFDNLLFFAGEEYMVQRIYIKQIAKKRNLEIRYIDAVADIYKQLGSVSLLGETYLYVVVDDKDFMSTSKMIEEVKSKLGKNVLVSLCISLDKRLSFYKTYKDTIVEFETLKSQNLAVYIKREIDLSDRNINILMEICEYSYGRCLLEIDKIKRCMIATDAENMPNNIFEMLVSDGTIHVPPRDAIFDFVKAVLQNKPKLAYELLSECIAIGEPNMVLLSVLYQNTRNVLQVQTCTSKDIEKSTGLSGWQIRNARECVGKFSDDDLIYLLELIQSAEQGIKQGTIEDSFAIDYVLTNFY